MENMFDQTQRTSGARMMLHRLRDHKLIDLKGEERIYRDAYLACLFENPRILDLWLNGYEPKMGYRNHKRNAKGKLLSCEAYLMGEEQ